MVDTVIASLIVVDYNSINKTLNYIVEFNKKITNRQQIPVVIVDNYLVDKNIQIEHFFHVKSEKTHFEDKDIYLYETCEFGKIIYCFANDNLGYAKGNNLGAKIARHYFQPDIFIVSNNDLRIIGTFDLSSIISLFDNDERIGVIGPKIIGLKGEVQSPQKQLPWYKGLIEAFWLKGWPFYKVIDDDYSNESKFCYRVMGSFMIIDSQKFFEVGMFDENTFMFGEEVILSERMKRHNYLVYFYNDLEILHEHGASVKKVASKIIAEKWMYSSLEYYYMNYKNLSLAAKCISKLSFEMYILRIKLVEIFRINTRWKSHE